MKTEEKSNEITAIPQLLQMLELDGRIVTNYDSAKGESLVERDSIACPELGD